MVIIKVTPANRPAVLCRAGALLRRGWVVVYPTDTAYALGGRFDDPQVRRKILAIKQRTDRKFTLVAADLPQVKRFFRLNRWADSLTRKLWPGPLSLVVNRRYAVRVPTHSLARALAALAGSPLIATSANISGQKIPYSVQAVLRQFKNSKILPDLIFDSGPLQPKKPSTIVEVLSSGQIVILRNGPISARSIGSSQSSTAHGEDRLKSICPDSVSLDGKCLEAEE